MALRYRDDEIIGPIVRLYVDAVVDLFILMHGNARSYTGRLASDYLGREENDVMDWPARWPDSNPIDHVSDDINTRVSRQEDKSTVF